MIVVGNGHCGNLSAHAERFLGNHQAGKQHFYYGTCRNRTPMSGLLRLIEIALLPLAHSVRSDQQPLRAIALHQKE